MDVVYTVDHGRLPSRQQHRRRCCLRWGQPDGMEQFRPRPNLGLIITYPQFLQELCVPLGLQIANGGIAGEISDNGPQQVTDYLALFPNSRYFVIGMGTNDLGTWPDTAATSKKIIDNLGQMVQLVMDQGKKAVLFNVPNANEAMFPPYVVRELREKRDYHNVRLKEFCGEQGIPLADIFSRLHDEHFADKLHPNDEGAKIIAEEVFEVLSAVHNSEQESSP